MSIYRLFYKPLWVIHNTYCENKDKLTDDGIIMTYHLNDGMYIFVNDS